MPNVKYGINNWNAYFPRENPRAPIVVMLGDSWFWYPDPGSGNLSQEIPALLPNNDQTDFVVVGANGLELRSYEKKSSKKSFEKLFENSSNLPYVSAVLISLGGNDISSRKDLLKIIQTPAIESSNPADYINEDSLVELGVSLYYKMQFILEYVRTKTKAPVVAHTYDYALPSGDGILWFGAWLKPVLDKKRVPNDPGLRCSILRVIVDVLSTSLGSIALEGKEFFLVDCRNTLQPEHWSNELHPTRTGFKRLARKWSTVLNQVTDLPFNKYL